MRLSPSRPRKGTSLIELLVALVLFSLFGAIALVQLSTNGRSLTALTDRLDAQSALWHGGDVAATELRPISPPAGDILLATDSSIWYRGLVAAGLLCAPPSGNSLLLLPDSLASGVRPGTGVSTAQAGDVAYLLDEGPTPGAADDRWLSATVSSVSSVSGLCAGSPLVDPVRDAGRRGYRVQLQPSSLPATVSVGAGVRIVRASRLALYRSSPDWFLGWTDWNTSLGAWNIIQPVAGKFRPYGAAPRPTGVGITMADSLGARVTIPGVTTNGSTLDLAIRTEVLTRQLGVGPTQALRTDSLAVRVALRNRQ